MAPPPPVLPLRPPHQCGSSGENINVFVDKQANDQLNKSFVAFNESLAFAIMSA